MSNYTLKKGRPDIEEGREMPYPADPGTWIRVNADIVSLKCGGCGRPTHLGTLHKVDTNGKVTPSIVCPYSGCDWHVWGTMEGWE